MNIIRLDINHWDDIKNLYQESLKAELDRDSKKPNSETYTESGLALRWELWSKGINTYYLNHDDFHYLYGCYDGPELLTILGWRCDLPKPYHRDWVIAWMKGAPTIRSTSVALPLLWRKMFEICEGKGLNRWHALVKKDRYFKFDAFERRYTADLHRHYRYETSLDIPKNTMPTVDWVWAMMGRHVLLEDYELRTGTRIDNV
jgi:hypothetical protein